jgi:hypothetical protein
MKLKLVTLAAALCTVGSAQALSPAATAAVTQKVYVSGASALRLSFGAYIQEICTPGSFDVFFDDAGTVGDGIVTTADGVNGRAYSCTLASAVGNYAAGSDVVVYKRDQGGSGAGVNPILTPAALSRIDVTAAGCVANVAQASPATDIQVPTFLCSSVDAAAVPDGGISDVEPALLQQFVNRQTNVAALAIPATVNFGSVVQGIFGVAVNKKLYTRLQQAQGLAQVDPPADQDTWTSADIANIPSLSTEFVRAALTGGITGSAAAVRGWNVVVPAAPLVAGKTINVCRRVEGSGTQAASNAFFALNPCQVGYAAALTPSGFTQTAAAPGVAGTNGTLGVRASSTAFREDTGTGGVETCLGTTVETAVNPADATDNEAYGLAVLGRENNPRANGGDKGYRFVKLDGVAPIRATAKAGDYQFVYEATLQWNTANAGLSADKIAFLTNLRSNIGRSASLAKADADTRQGVMAPPATYGAVPYLSLTNVDEVAFGSRVARANNNSCTPIRIIK